MSFLRDERASYRQCPVVAYWALRGMSPEQNMTHTAFVDGYQLITLLKGGNLIPRTSGFPSPRFSLMRTV